MKERKFSKNQIAEIRAKLMQDGTVFNCFGAQFKTSKMECWNNRDPIYSIANYDCTHQMNVNKFGPTCITLFTYDMLGNRTSGKFRYDLIEFENKEA